MDSQSIKEKKEKILEQIRDHTCSINRLDSNIDENVEIMRKKNRKNASDLQYIKKLQGKCERREIILKKIRENIEFFKGEKNGYQKRINQLKDEKDEIDNLYEKKETIPSEFSDGINKEFNEECFKNIDAKILAKCLEKIANCEN
jgi:hypothetical protein